MSTKDFIKKSVLNAFTQYDAPKLAVALLAALALGILIYLVYRKFYTGVVYSRSFAVTLVGMCVLTCMVTLAISTNVVISLGMVGALSIVRFRTAVKDPLDLLYLFWSITTGITAGAGMYALGLVTAAVMIAMIYLFSHWQAKGRVYIAVIHYVGTEAGDDIVRALGRIKYAVKSKTMRGRKYRDGGRGILQRSQHGICRPYPRCKGGTGCHPYPVQRGVSWVKFQGSWRQGSVCWGWEQR